MQNGWACKVNEWEHHVIKVDKPLRVSYCGVKIGIEFALVDAQHAKQCVEQQTRIQPCPKCWKEIENEENA